MTWKELKELAEEAGVKDETELEIEICYDEPKETVQSSLTETNVWIVE